MRKIIYLLICIFICFTGACHPCEEVINGESEYKELVDSGKYYQIYKGDITRVLYKIYDTNGKVVLSEITERPLSINMLNESIVDIGIGIGTGVTIHRYYNAEENVFSQEFEYVLSNKDDLIAYMYTPKENSFEDRKIVVQNIFNQKLYYEEFQIDDFLNIDTPVVEASFSSDGTELLLIYLSGDEQTKISKILKLN